MRKSNTFATPLIGVDYLPPHCVQVVHAKPFMQGSDNAIGFIGEDSCLPALTEWVKAPWWVCAQPPIAEVNPRIQHRLDAVHTLYRLARLLSPRPGTWRRRCFKLAVKLADKGII